MQSIPPLAYIPGSGPEVEFPLQRFLPPIRSGMMSAMLERTPPADGWLLDPFGSHPGLALEIASSGRPLMVASNNPILAFALKVMAANHSLDLAQSAIAALASSRKGGEPLERHIRSMYETECPRCSAIIQADGYIWKKGEKLPVSRLLRCPECALSGEFPITPMDENSLRGIGNDSLHRARALDRIIQPGDPIEQAVRELLAFYQPRPLYVLFTIINRIEMLELSTDQREILSALALTLCDQASSLWAYPSSRSRPRQLTAAAQYREFNLWKVLEDSLRLWCQRLPARVELTRWPDIPAGNGICLFPNRIRDLMPLEDEIHFRGVAAAFPRPIQALWALSALWSGWLWGRQAVAPLRNALDRKRYDWAWHSAALDQAVTAIARNAAEHLPIYALAAEMSPGLALSIFTALQKANIDLTGLAYSESEEMLQLTGKFDRKARKPGKPLDSIFPEAVELELEERGGPSRYQTLLVKALSSALKENTPLPQPTRTPQGGQAETLQQRLQRLISDPTRFIRLGSQAADPESGWWWLRKPAPDAQTHLDERVEMAVVKALQKQLEISEDKLYQTLCAAFPGTLTPDLEFVQAILESYGQQEDSANWRLNPHENPRQRTTDLQEIRTALKQIAGQLGLRSEIFKTAPGNAHETCLWTDSSGEPSYLFYISASACVQADLLQPQPVPINRCITVIPGGRSQLISLRLARDPRLAQLAAQGWRFVKFRQVRSLAEIGDLSLKGLEAAFAKDPPTQQESEQLSLF